MISQLRTAVLFCSTYTEQIGGQGHSFFYCPSQLRVTRRLRLKCDGTRAETRFRLSANRTSPFKSAGASVQSITGSRSVRINGSNAGYTMFRGSVKGTGYPLHSPISPSLPLPCVTVCRHVSTRHYLHGEGPFFRSQYFLTYWRNSLCFMELEIALLCSQGPATSPCPELEQSIPLPPNSEVICYYFTVCKVSGVLATDVKNRWNFLKKFND